MGRKSRKILSILLSFALLWQQSSYAQVLTIDMGKFFGIPSAFTAAGRFRAPNLKYFAYDPANNGLKVLIDKGDFKDLSGLKLKDSTQVLLKYFLIGVTLPDEAFWVNLRPDAEDNIIDPELARTDIGKILLETDLQLKKDTALATSPQTREGKEYWDKLYKKAGELFGHENITIPTLTRPWIVPGEVILREGNGSVYIYKAALKVMLEQDHLKGSLDYKFDDPRMKTLNEYSSQLIRELIIPKLTKRVNTAKEYSQLRQVYSSLIIARWFKARYSNKKGAYPVLINKRNLTNLTSNESWSKTTYFNEYKKSFKDGEYNIQVPAYTITGQTIRNYFSGGIALGADALQLPKGPGVSSPIGGFKGNKADAALLRQPNTTLLSASVRDRVIPNLVSGQDSASSPVDQGTARYVYPYSAFSIPLIEDEATLQAIENHMVLLQAGKDYLNGKAQVGRTASLINWMWTDLLRDKDPVGFTLHKEKLILTAKFTQALKSRNFKAAVATLSRYVEIRDALCQRWLSLAIDAHNKVNNLPDYAFVYENKMFNQEGYEVLIELFRSHGDNLRNISPYTLDPIATLVKEAKADGIAIMPLGAGGPGANCIAVSERGLEHLKNFFEARGIELLEEDAARKIVRGDLSLKDKIVTLRGYIPFKVGRNPIQIKGFDQLEGVKLPQAADEAEYNPETGELRIADAGKIVSGPWIRGKWFRPRHDFKHGEPLDSAWISGRLRISSEEARKLIASSSNGLEIIAHLRGVDGCGSSLDLPEFQIALTNEGAKLIIDLPSTPTIASDFTVKIKFGLANDINAIVYEAPDYFLGEHSVTDIDFVPHFDVAKRKAGIMMPKYGQKDAPAYIFKKLFGLSGIKVTCEEISPMAIAGGMESSNAFNVALIAAASMLSGADLNLAEIFNLAVKLENDELNGLTGGQGHLSSMLGGAYQNLWLSGVKDVSVVSSPVRAKDLRAERVTLNSRLEAEEARLDNLRNSGASADEIRMQSLVVDSISDVLSDVETAERKSSSPVQSPDTLGGIDLRSIPMMIQPMGGFSGLQFNLPGSNYLNSVNLDRELKEIKAMVAGGIIPSGERLKEYVAACYQKKAARDKLNSLIPELIQVCKLQEEAGMEADQSLRQALVLVDAI